MSVSVVPPTFDRFDLLGSVLVDCRPVTTSTTTGVFGCEGDDLPGRTNESQQLGLSSRFLTQNIANDPYSDVSSMTLIIEPR